LLEQGNDGVVGIGEHVLLDGAIDILHFPVRTLRQLENKISKGGAAYARNKVLPPDVGSTTWRRLYEEFQTDGSLKAYFSSQFYTPDRLAAQLAAAELLEDRRLADYLGRLQRHKMAHD
jgi:hypothetical protein